ncbi:MAG: NAD(P)/FAD-dependent oxidoreductase [Candidatus Tectimicrobiota bacterium]
MSSVSHPWGEPVWSYPIPVAPQPAPDGMHLDVAVVGAGFTGLATAHYLLQRWPEQRVAIFEAQTVGAGASGRTGGLVLEDTAVGPLPGLERCVATVRELVQSQQIDCHLVLNNCWEIGRQYIQPTSPLQWTDQGTLGVVNVIPGGAFEPRQFLAGLVRLVERAGGQIFEHAPVTALEHQAPGDVRLGVAGQTVLARRVIFGTNPFCLDLQGLEGWAGGVHTIATATEPLADAVFEAIGWGSRTPFFTVDTPYLWGRVTPDNRAVIGAGLTGHNNVAGARVDAPEAVQIFATLEDRIRHLHPALEDIRITHRWLGPLCFTGDSKPVIACKDRDERILVGTGYRGHGVALAVRIGKLFADVLAGQSSLPAWSYRPSSKP